MSAPLPGWSFFVLGEAAPQGSKRHVGGGRMIESSKRVAPWRQAVSAAAAGAGPRLDGPIVAAAIFTVPRPSGANRRRLAPDRTPDTVKLLRAAEDSVTDVGLWADDARVVAYTPVAKVYPDMPYPGVPASSVLPVPGLVFAAVSVEPDIPPARGRPKPSVTVDEAVARLGIPRVAAAALIRIEAPDAERLDELAQIRLEHPDSFASMICTVRGTDRTRAAEARAARSVPPEIPDCRDRLDDLLASAGDRARQALSAWKLDEQIGA